MCIAVEMRNLQQVIKIWRQLRSPFVLPVTTAKCHVCEWEKLDIDVLGCTVCGKLHACEYGTCTETEQTSDGLVCNLSGVVVYTKLYVETEFMDTLCVTGREAPEEVCGGDVSQIVSCLLCSPKQEGVKRSCLLSMLEKCSNTHNRHLRSSGNGMSVCMQMLLQFNNTPYLFAYMSKAQRQRLVPGTVQHCCRVLHILTKYGMQIKSNEVQRLAVGIVYLMRCGVTMDGVYVLPRVPELEMLLPPETLLFAAYGVHPKYITEMENRLKFCLRHGSRSLNEYL